MLINLGVKLVRIDMSEYMEKHSVSKLIGSPPGYVGHEDNAGILITKLQESPNCVLLLDEIEKAHPDVAQILLQVMDNGKLTGSNGKEADARNCTLILTTNLGARDSEKNTIGFGNESEHVYEDKALKKFFSPEFRNRLDGVITFASLGKPVMMKIVGKFLVELKDMVKDKHINITITDEALDHLVDKGFDPKMGARPLQRVIDRDIKRPLSKQILFGDLKNGGKVVVDFKDGELVLDCVNEMQLKRFESSKLFYSEYLYKLVFRNELNVIFRSELQKKEKLSYARNQLDTLTEQYRNNLPLYKKQWRAEILIDTNDYFDAMTTYSVLKKSTEYKLRIDPYSTITLFSNNKDFLLDLGSKLKTDTLNFWGPDPDHIDILKSKTKIQIVDKIPELPIKVWFNSTRINQDFGNWLRVNKDKCRIGTIALDSLESYGYMNGLYIYLRDEKVLNLVTLLAGASIRSVEKLVYRGDIDKY